MKTFRPVATMIMMFLLDVIGTLGYLVTFQIQENFYTSSNAYHDLYVWLGPWQLSGTSFFIVLTVCSLGGMFFLSVVYYLPRMIKFYPWILGGVVVPILSFYLLYELSQYLVPSYPDNYGYDALAACLAAFMYLCGLLSVNFSKRG